MSADLLPKDLAGYQHLIPEEMVLDGDLAVHHGKPLYFLWKDGRTVGKFEIAYSVNVYRKIPVAKQGDAHDREMTEGYKIAPDGTKLWRDKDGGYAPSGFMDDGPDVLVEAKTLPADAAKRKATPVYSGFLKYFPLAVAEVARVSQAGNDQHNPGKPLHWDRSKSGDELDALARHLLEAGKFDTDGQRHSAKAAWRAMASLQKELEAEHRASDGRAEN